MADLTPEQIQELQTKATNLENQLKDMVPKTEVEKAKDDVRKEFEGKVDPNWQKARQTIDALRKIANDKGIKVDDDGNVINPSINVDEITTKAMEAGRGAAVQQMLTDRLDEELEVFESDSRAVIKHYYEKLTAGEKVDLKSIKKFVNQAVAAANDDDKPIKRVNINGRPPVTNTNETKLSDEVANTMGSSMGLPFVTKPYGKK